MKVHAVPALTSRRLTLRSKTRVVLLIALIALIVIPLFSSSLALPISSLASSRAVPKQGSVREKATAANAKGMFENYLGASVGRHFRSISPALVETIETFAADCTTPKSSFFLGETVCAKTDNVDLGFPGGRWVHWIRPNLSIAYGGSGTTPITTNPQTFTFAPDTVGTWKATIAETGDDSQTPVVFTVSSTPLATYKSGCLQAESSFTLGDVVCARVTGVDSGLNRRLYWIDPAGNLRAVTPITSDPQTDSFTLPTADTEVIGNDVVNNTGTWKVNIVSSRGSVVVSVLFNVAGSTPTADVGVAKAIIGDSPSSGANFTYLVAVTNYGPSHADNVVLTDPQPVNATFSSIIQTSGPTTPGFSCLGSNPVVCTRVLGLAAGEVATFEITYTAGSSGTITNTATVDTDTTDPNSANDTGTAGPITINDGGGGDDSSCTLDCPADMVVTATSPSGAVVDFSEGFVVAGNCGSISSIPASGSLFPVGTTTVTAMSSVGGGTCTFHVTVVNSPAPTITCPLPTLTGNAPNGQTETTVAVSTPAATGTCVTVVGSRDDDREVSDPYPVGTTVITWTATETLGTCGNGTPGRTASCSQIVTVTSGDAPTITCPPDRLFTTADCTYTATLAEIGSPSTTGNLAPPDPGETNPAGVRSDHLPLTDPFPAGVTVITWTATDTVGRVVSCNQNINVNSTGDSTPPTLHIPPDIFVTTTSCSEVLDDELGVATAEDACSAVSISRTGIPTFTCPIPGNPTHQCESFVFPVGTTNIIYTATDGSGHSTSATQHVTVHESTPPTITAPASLLTLNTGGVGGASCGTVVSDAMLGTATANDNCPGVTVARTGVPAGNNFPVGDTIITYTATDASGNTNTVPATQTVRVTDNTPPVITSVPSGGQTDAGSCTATIPNVATGTVASDNCAILSKTQIPTAGTAVGLGTHTITVTVTDTHGNSSQAQTTFTVNALQFTGNFWLGLKNSDDVGTKFDLLAEVFRNGAPVGSSQINDLPSGSSGFNNAILRTLGGTISSVGFCTGDTLSVKLSVRVSASSPPGHTSGTIRLWYNSAAANSRFGKVVNGVTTPYYLRTGLLLNEATGSTQSTIDVLINRNQNGNAFKPFGTWTKTF